MKRGVAYGLLLAIAVQITSAVQLFKIPVLWEHYAEHQQRSPGLSLWDFLAMHYWRGEEPDGDADRDMELPFKKSERSVLQLQAAQAGTPAFAVPAATPVWGTPPDYGLTPPSALPETFQGALFKPPKA